MPAGSGVELPLQLGPFGDRQLAGEALADVRGRLAIDLGTVTQERNGVGGVRVPWTGHRQDDVRTEAGADAPHELKRFLVRWFANDGDLLHRADREVERAQG